MNYSLSNMLSNGGSLNADGLSLDLAFALDKTLTARKGPTPVFTRASTATFIGSDGLIQSAAINVPRFDHDPVTGDCKGLLIEESRTNASLYSGAIVINTGWASSETTSVVDGAGPDGDNAYTATETSATAIHTVANTGGPAGTGATTVISGVVYTGSIFIKKVTGSIDWVQLTLGSAGFGTSQYANFNIDTGAIGNSAGLASGTSPRIENFGNGWYRCSISVAATTTTAVSLNTILAFINNNNGTTRVPSYQGNVANKVLVSLCQFEAGAFATSYIPTTTAPLTRSADVCSITGSAFSGMWNASEGSLFTSAIFNAPVSYGTSQATVDINDTTTANRLRLTKGNATGFMSFNNTSNSIQNVSIITTSATPSFTSQKLSIGFKLDDFVFYANNSQIGSDNSGAMIVSPTTFTIGDASAAFTTRFHTNGTISSIRYYRKRLDNSKLQALTV